MPLEIENKTYSVTFVATNLMQTIKLLELHKIQEVAFGDSSWTLSPKKHKAKPNKKILQNTKKITITSFGITQPRIISHQQKIPIMVSHLNCFEIKSKYLN